MFATHKINKAKVLTLYLLVALSLAPLTANSMDVSPGGVSKNAPGSWQGQNIDQMLEGFTKLDKKKQKEEAQKISKHFGELFTHLMAQNPDIRESVLKEIVFGVWASKGSLSDIFVQIKGNDAAKITLKEMINDKKESWLQEFYNISDANAKAELKQFLNGKLVYTRPSDGKKFMFPIRNLDNPLAGTFDLSYKTIFGDTTKGIVITTDPAVFFAKHENKLVILIASWSLINNTITTSAAPFAPIMQNWNRENAPIGIFWRDGNWSNKSWYDLLTDTPIPSYTQETLDKLWDKRDWRPRTRPINTFFASGYPGTELFKVIF